MKDGFISRAIKAEFERKLVSGKVLILLGARRVGKTEFVKNLISTHPELSVLSMNRDDLGDLELLSERRTVHYKRLLGGIDLLFIDEAQNIPEAGKVLKLMVDTMPNLKVIATGSSTFDLSNKIGEPLVGRKNTIYLFPLSQMEFNKLETYKKTSEKLESRLIFGSYPELEKYVNWEEKREYLEEIVNAYLLKDILVYQGIRNSQKIFDLLKLIAHQIGSEVSIEELGKKLSISKNTVANYLDLLTKVFIIYRLDGFSRNLRKEVTKSKKWYFYDNGIRNAIVQNFNRLKDRSDIGQLWENYLISERLKKQHYTRMRTNNFFWRTYDQQELDWLEESDQHLSAFEFKWSDRKKAKAPAAFQKAYPDANFRLVNRDNYLDFIM